MSKGSKQAGIVFLGLLGLSEAGLSGCKGDATQILVTVTSDLEIPTELASVSAHVFSEVRAGARPTAEMTFPMHEGSIPFSFGVAPSKDPEGPVVIAVDAIGPKGELLFTERAITAFAKGKTLLLSIELLESCLEVPSCKLGETCRGGSCQSELHPALAEVAPGDELKGVVIPMRRNRDAGVPDSGAPDAARADASASDGGGSDTGVVGFDSGVGPTDAAAGDAIVRDATAGDATAGDATAGDATAGDATAGDATAGDAALADSGVADSGIVLLDASVMVEPLPCNTPQDCPSSACPMGSQGCTCADTPQGKRCIATCSMQNTFCTPPLRCDVAHNVCTP